MPPRVDEETPLLRDQQPKIKRTPLPWFQFTIVLFLQLAEPLTSQVIYPFTPQLIRDIGITHGDETKVGHYVGLLQSLFFLTQAMTVLHWSRISDRVGRKPVILTGLFGLSLSMYCFGLSKTFWGLVMSRSLNGALNGNIGVIKSIMAEITDSTNIAQAYAYMPIAWSTGGVLGPIIGGALSRPADQYPEIFGQSEFLKKYPYFLPCAVPATFSAIAWIVTFLFLKETVRSPLSISRLFNFRKSKANLTLQNVVASQEPTASTTPDDVTTAIPENEKPVPLSKLFIPRVLIAAGNYACLSLVDISVRAIQPLFFSTPIEHGGLGLPPSMIGNLMSIFGFLNGITQIFFFAKIHDKLGSKITFTIGIASAIPVFLTFPAIRYLVLANQGVTPLVWVLVGLQIVVSILLSFSYGAIFIYIQAASPNRASLGATNGLSQMWVSITRAIGPATANSLFSLSMKEHYLGGYMVYYVLLGMAAMALFASSLLPRKVSL
ncbi:member of major facilitator superfamily multidrug- dha1 sub-family [Moniliophthora roreri MCA 2997]|uniref:Member of major facilitator superfamily multidrug-dha1 sub-family n=2 Tax=Moniliophthora roreri TaxID=221103 RepID=V2X9I4_MONRO|nr:member of major facilitator superfamily multidrug- dha1 sub-family [Moniliophthora roreri MCA 2997]KAI3615843.1 member of major facilitator superfamily multidrug-dha1 sub-family [Moniliophthora roreri]